MEETDLNIGSLCRLCGSKTQSGDKVEIFSSDDLSHQIRSLLALDLSENDLLPTFVCSECAAKLEDFNKFKASSHRTNLMFREFLDNARDASCVDCPGLSDNVAMDTVLNDSVTIDEFKFEDEPESDVSNYISEPIISVNIEQFLKSDPLALELNSISKSTSEVQPNITNVQCPSTNPTAQPCNSLTGVQFQRLQTSPEDTLKSSKVQVPRSLSSPSVCRKNKEEDKLAKNIKNKSCNTHKCKVCNIVFKYAYQLRYHMKYHNKDFDYCCSYCNKGFISNFKMQEHIRANHTKEYPFLCEKCGQKFVTQYALRSHIETYHINTKNYYCKICKMSFKLAKYLRAHALRVHLGIDVPIAFSCDVCDDVFDDKTNLIKHISTYHQAVKEPEETIYPWSLVQRCHKLPPTSVQDKESQVAGVEVQPSVESTISSQEIEKNDSPNLIQDNTVQAASVKAMPLGKSSQKSRKNPETVKNDSNVNHIVFNTFKGKIFKVKIFNNPRKLKDLGTKNPKPTEGSNNTEITNRTVSEIEIDQNPSENSNNSKENKTESTKQLENLDLKVNHAIVNIIACPYCHLVFKHINELNCHIRNAHQVHCNHCLESFHRDEDLQEHIKAEHTKVVVDLKDSDNVFFKSGQLQEENAKEPSEKKYFQCTLCPKNFNTWRSLKFHQRRLHDANRKQYKCELCKDKVYSTKDGVRRHIQVTHLGILHKCDFCDKKFASLDSVTAHRASKHSNSKKHVCNICNKSFAIIRYLRRHQKTHDNTIHYQCTKCFKAFKRSTSLKSHLVRYPNCGNNIKYDNTNAYQCTKCIDKTFKLSKSLKRHLIKHHNCINISEIQ